MRRYPLGSAAAAAAVLAGLAACSAPGVSTLAGAGREAESVARLFWIMLAVALLVWALVVGIAIYATWRPRQRTERVGHWLVIGGGFVLPTVLLGMLLFHGLLLMPRLREPGTRPGARVEVTGEQWWWRVRYAGFGSGAPVVLANEVRLPVGERTEFLLDSPDVIHSFWIPELGGKVDMIPGRTNRLVLEPSRAGIFRGACAEYCGTSHAYMQFAAVAMERDAFEAWLRRQQAPAREPWSALAKDGQAAFLRNGCSACHAIRGTAAHGATGPDLTHVGSRLTLGAGAADNDAAGFRRWIEQTHALKPDVLMPSFGMLPDAEIDALALYLDGLQ